MIAGSSAFRYGLAYRGGAIYNAGNGKVTVSEDTVFFNNCVRFDTTCYVIYTTCYGQIRKASCMHMHHGVSLVVHASMLRTTHTAGAVLAVGFVHLHVYEYIWFASCNPASCWI